jgi:hypothetical protein
VTVLAAAAGPDSVTLVTGILLALAAIISSLTPIVIARRRSRKEALAVAAASAADSGSLTLAGWTALNAALQQEISRLQGLVVRMQARIDLLEGEITELQKVAMSLRKGNAGG